MLKNDIILRNVTKAYHQVPVLKHISFTFRAGGAYCLTAPSGTGKTTLLHLLMGLTAPDEGTISGIHNSKISAVFQEDRLLDGYTALQNIRFVTANRYTDAEILEKMALLLPKECFPRPVREFSGGMRRRLCILRALLVPADLYLMDEPFAGLDSHAKDAAVSLIREMTQNKTLILATHAAQDAAALRASALRLSFGSIHEDSDAVCGQCHSF